MTTSLVKTSKDRSPRYPVISLPEALKRAVRVWKRDRRNKIPKEVVAEHMGYTTLNGASLGAIAAAFKYGLLEGSREAMGVTERAVAIFVHEKGSPEWTEMRSSRTAGATKRYAPTSSPRPASCPTPQSRSCAFTARRSRLLPIQPPPMTPRWRTATRRRRWQRQHRRWAACTRTRPP
jgi:hypothetical protein